jgi:hypothetical protein
MKAYSTFTAITAGKGNPIPQYECTQGAKNMFQGTFSGNETIPAIQRKQIPL